jgi:hypothetical protein
MLELQRKVLELCTTSFDFCKWEQCVPWLVKHKRGSSDHQLFAMYVGINTNSPYSSYVVIEHRKVPDVNQAELKPAEAIVE